MLIASFDMGLKNFAFAVEYVHTIDTEEFKDNRFNVDGTPTTEYDKILQKNYKNGCLVECQCIDIIQYCKDNNIKNIYVGLTQILNTFSRLWDKTDVFLIEQQMSYGHQKSNIKALRLAQHCISYFTVIYLSKTIIEYSSTLKTRVLGCSHQQRATHKSRKKFSMDLVKYILNYRKDSCLTYYQTFLKKDDISDCVLMIQSYKIGLSIK